MPKLIKLVLSIAICEGAGIIGSVATFPAIPTWYAYLNKPPFSPPNFIFAPVWTILYLLMGISLFLIWQNTSKTLKKAKDESIQVFAAQLLLNVMWSIAFFGFHSPLAGLIIIIIMWILILETIRKFSKINKTAGFLLYPYLAWVSFASILNFSVWILNR